MKQVYFHNPWNKTHSFNSDGYVGSFSAVSPHCNFNTLKKTGEKKHITTVYRKVLEVLNEIIIMEKFPHPSSPGQT